MADVKIWYIDRSRNYYYPELPNGLKTIVETYNQGEGILITPDIIINDLVRGGVIKPDAKNKFAHLTRFRDHGFINMYNNPGESTIDFVEGRLDLDALIIDHFIKRPVYKDNPKPNIKPFVLICKFFSVLFGLTKDDSEYYITTYECKNYLYSCQDYDEINTKFVKDVISDRHSGVIVNKEMEDNEQTNFSIWFNALKLTSIMEPKSSRESLVPNKYAKPFFCFIAKNAHLLEPTPACDSKGDSSLQYEYYCNRRKGINEILAKCIKSNVRLDSIEATKKLYLFLFGLKKDRDFKYEKYIKNPESNFGVYYPLINLPYLAIRHIWLQNSFIADSLYKLLSTDEKEIIQG